MTASATPEPDWPTLDAIQEATRVHRRAHGCGAYTFEDGPGLVALACEARAVRALELGAALGYTACCLASAGDLTIVDTIELDPQHVALARRNIERCGLAGRVTVHQGEFRTVVEQMTPGYDLVFFDGFAPDASLIARLHDLLRTGGVLVCANLSLVAPGERGRLEDELRDTFRWARAGTLEQGGTEVYEARR